MQSCCYCFIKGSSFCEVLRRVYYAISFSLELCDLSQTPEVRREACSRALAMVALIEFFYTQ